MPKTFPTFEASQLLSKHFLKSSLKESIRKETKSLKLNYVYCECGLVLYMLELACKEQ